MRGVSDLQRKAEEVTAPAPAEIDAAKELIQSEWSESTRLSRAGLTCEVREREGHWTPPIVDMSMFQEAGLPVE